MGKNYSSGKKKKVFSGRAPSGSKKESSEKRPQKGPWKGRGSRIENGRKVKKKEKVPGSINI